MTTTAVPRRPTRRPRIVTALELEVLRLLAQEPRRWWTSAGLASQLVLYPFRARGCLQALKRAGLVECRRARHTYCWAITQAALEELAQRTAGVGTGLPHDGTAERCRGESSRPTTTRQERTR